MVPAFISNLRREKQAWDNADPTGWEKRVRDGELLSFERIRPLLRAFLRTEAPHPSEGASAPAPPAEPAQELFLCPIGGTYGRGAAGELVRAKIMPIQVAAQQQQQSAGAPAPEQLPVPEGDQDQMMEEAEAAAPLPQYYNPPTPTPTPTATPSPAPPVDPTSIRGRLQASPACPHAAMEVFRSVHAPVTDPADAAALATAFVRHVERRVQVCIDGVEVSAEFFTENFED